MGKNLQRLLLCVMAIFCLHVLGKSITVKAYNSTIYQIDATQDSVTIDWSDAVNDLRREYKEEGCNNLYFKTFQLGYCEMPCTADDAMKNAINVDPALWINGRLLISKRRTRHGFFAIAAKYQLLT
ncbi:hypothetical protein [Butyrivibrio sp. AE3004]|uniref:hypothetical protein n=1 Tax=Butyrivibrio sp. AE3004 TaxID=1506994 RepID=UPI00055D8DE0|nr:hypothetical protein [Butyrivibrio sp. AE3004]